MDRQSEQPDGHLPGQGACANSSSPFPSTIPVVLDEAYFEYAIDADYPTPAAGWVIFRNPDRDQDLFQGLWPGGAARRLRPVSSRCGPICSTGCASRSMSTALPKAGALAALADREHLQQSVALNRRGMAQLVDGVQRIGLQFIPSAGNFLTIDLGREASPVDQALLRLGVITRPVANYGLPNHPRVSIGLESENARFLQALEQVL